MFTMMYSDCSVIKGTTKRYISYTCITLSEMALSTTIGLGSTIKTHSFVAKGPCKNLIEVSKTKLVAKRGGGV